MTVPEGNMTKPKLRSSRTHAVKGYRRFTVKLCVHIQDWRNSPKTLYPSTGCQNPEEFGLPHQLLHLQLTYLPYFNRVGRRYDPVPCSEPHTQHRPVFPSWRNNWNDTTTNIQAIITVSKSVNKLRGSLYEQTRYSKHPSVQQNEADLLHISGHQILALRTLVFRSLSPCSAPNSLSGLRRGAASIVGAVLHPIPPIHMKKTHNFSSPSKICWS
jgi:hypothetical protein